MALILLLVAVSLLPLSWAHGGHEAKAPCDGPAASFALVSAEYVPGVITVDGDSSDWNSIEGHQFALYPALDPNSGDAYPGKITVKVAHDGRDLFFLLQVPGNYQYKQGEKHSSPSVGLMFPVGDDATYVDMGGCSESLNCSKQSCAGHEVDIMHFSISNAIPGRIYGANLIDNLKGTGQDSIGSLHDTWAWNPHCRYFDGAGPGGSESGGAQNDWKGVWSHTSINNDFGLTVSDSPYGSVASPGSYAFEFSRPLRTSDRLQQDAQFTIGRSHKFAAAFWYPMNNAPWSPIQHYSANCDWIPLKILPGSESERAESSTLATSISTFSLFFALGSLFASAAIVWWVRTSKNVPFSPIGNSL